MGSGNAPEGLHGGRLRQLPRLEPEGDVGGGLCVDNQPDYDALSLHLHHAQERRGTAESDARLRHQCPSQVSKNINIEVLVTLSIKRYIPLNTFLSHNSLF